MAEYPIPFAPLIGVSSTFAKAITGIPEPTIVLMGDSITARNEVTSATSKLWVTDGFWNWAAIFNDQTPYMVNCAGVSGDHTEEMWARFDADVLAYSPGWVCIMAGINDIQRGDSAEFTIQYLTAMYQRALQNGIRVIACTILPSTVVSTSLRRRTLMYINQWIRTYARATPGIVLADTYIAWADPATGDPAAGLTGDGTHPTNLGARVVGQCIADAMAIYLPSTPQFVQSLNLDYQNAVYNGMANGDNASGTNGYVNATGFTGTGPDGWTNVRSGTSTAVSSKVARTDYRQGSFAQLAATIGGNNETVAYNLRTDIIPWSAATAKTAGQSYVEPRTPNGYWYVCTVNGTTGATEPAWPTNLGDTASDNGITWRCVQKINPGDSVYAQCEFQTNTLVGNGSVELSMLFQDQAFASLMQAIDNQIAGYTSLPSAVPASGVLRTPTVIAPEGFTRIHLRPAFRGSAGATCNFLVSSCEVRKVEPI